MNSANEVLSPGVQAIVDELTWRHPESDGYPANPITVGEYDGHYVTLTVAGSIYHEGEGDGTQWFLILPTSIGATVVTAYDADWHEAINTSDGNRHMVGLERLAGKAMA